MGKKMKRPSKHQIRKDLKKIETELKNNKIILAVAFIAGIALLYFWWGDRENNIIRISLIISCMVFSVGFSKFYTTNYKYKQGLKEIEDRKKR